jgi:UBX domain-containing protein 1
MPGTLALLTSRRSELTKQCCSRAPPSILDVLPGQPVELRVSRRTEEDYVAIPRRGFAGSGNRLGGVVPESSAAPAPAPAVPQVGMPGAFPVAVGSSSAASSTSQPARTRELESADTRFAVDQTKPTTSVQVRLADGTRLDRTVALWPFAVVYADVPAFLPSSLEWWRV